MKNGSIAFLKDGVPGWMLEGRNIVVTEGLKEGEQVIVEGIQKVRPGQVVTATVVPGT